MKALIATVIAFAVGFPAFAAEMSPGVIRMMAPQAPFKISDNIYYVGAADATVFLIDGGDGLILTDGAFTQNAPMIEDNIKKLGFDIRKVKVLLNSHSHFDHAGGLAKLKADTGAKLYAAPGDVPVLESGGKGDYADFGPMGEFTPVHVDEKLSDGQKITVGKATLTIHLTPGHTRGCASWTIQTPVDGKLKDVVFVCSLTVHPQYRLVKNPSYPGIAEDFRASVKTLRSLPCDILLGSHGQFFDLQAKIAKLTAGGPNPFVDPQGCRAYFDGAAAAIEAAITKEQAAP